MARDTASRKYQLTINNPLEKGFTHEQIRKNLSELKLLYWCMCDEIGGEEHTPHTHIYLVAQNAISFSTIQKRFFGAHIEPAKGTSRQNRDYIRKEGEYTDSEKHTTNLPETFEEWGDMPVERQGVSKVCEDVYQMIKDGCDNRTILERYPSYMNKLQHIENTRQTLLQDENAEKFRKLEVWYIYGETGVGKTRSVMEQYGYRNVYRVTNYEHPFDQYKGEKVLLLDEFRSSLPINLMLNLLDGYPMQLPCRYANRTACFTTVYIISNIPLEQQYTNIQQDQPQTWQALLRRIPFVEYKTKNEEMIFLDDVFDAQEKGEVC